MYRTNNYLHSKKEDKQKTMTQEMMKGVVERITQNGRSWSSFINGSWYGGVWSKPAWAEGDTIEFEVAHNGKWLNIADEGKNAIIHKLNKPTSKGPSTAEGKFPQGKEDYWTKREERDEEIQQRITLQASRNAAISFIELLLKAEALKLPTKDRLSMMESMLAHYTNKFYNETSGKAPPAPVSGAAQTEDDEVAF